MQIQMAILSDWIFDDIMVNLHFKEKVKNRQTNRDFIAETGDFSRFSMIYHEFWRYLMNNRDFDDMGIYSMRGLRAGCISDSLLMKDDVKTDYIAFHLHTTLTRRIMINWLGLQLRIEGIAWKKEKDPIDNRERLKRAETLEVYRGEHNRSLKCSSI